MKLGLLVGAITVLWAQSVFAQEAGRCVSPQPLGAIESGPRWTSWGNDDDNSRFQPAAQAGLTAADVPYVVEAVRLLVAELGPTPLIGFAGAPYTLASYLVEGGPSKEQLKTRALMHSDPQTWSALLTWCAEITGAFLESQLEAGASAGQLFDSWAGSLSLADYTEHVAPHSARALGRARRGRRGHVCDTLSLLGHG